MDVFGTRARYPSGNIRRGNGENSLGNIRSIVGMRLGPVGPTRDRSSSPAKHQFAGEFVKQRTTDVVNYSNYDKRAQAVSFLPKLQKGKLGEDFAKTNLNMFFQKWTKPDKEHYWCYLGMGNTEAVDQVLKNRGYWAFAQHANDPRVRFIWKQTIAGINFQAYSNQMLGSLRVFNHFENHRELSQKDYLLRNFHKYCVVHGLEVFDFLPPTFELKLDAKGQPISKEGIKEEPDWTHSFRKKQVQKLLSRLAPINQSYLLDEYHILSRFSRMHSKDRRS